MTNEELKKEYPFLIIRNRWTDKATDDINLTELDDMPSGWRKAFGEQMCAELKEILIEADYLYDYRITQIKEKYGILCWYDSGVPKSVYDKYITWLTKYEDLSKHICIRCGDSATHISKRWISPYCTNCANELSKHMGQFECINSNNWYFDLEEKNE